MNCSKLAWIAAGLGVAAACGHDEHGVLVRVYDIGRGVQAVPELPPDAKPSVAIIRPTIDLTAANGGFGGLEDNFVTRVDGWLVIEQGGEYTFQLNSDDGSKLYIDDELVIQHDGPRGMEPGKEATVALQPGRRALRIEHYEGSGSEGLRLTWKPAGAEAFALVDSERLLPNMEISRETGTGVVAIVPPLRRGLPGDGSPLERVHPIVTAMQQDSPLQDAAVARHPIRQGPYAGQHFAPGEEWRRIVDDGPNRSEFRFSAPPQPAGGSSAGDAPPFEMLAIDGKANGLEITFTRPLAEGIGWDPGDYLVEQRPFAGGKPARRDGKRYPVTSATVSADRTKVFLEIPDLKAAHVAYVRLLMPCYSADGERPWSTEAWYTLNELPSERGTPGAAPERPAQNELTQAERDAGWRLLFDGESLDGWHRYGKPGEAPRGWEVLDGCLVRSGPGGDIATNEVFENFELALEWRIAAGGNSGIMYRVDESLPAPYFTGPEMQVLDNGEHNDGRNTATSAGANYALHAAARDVTVPVGYFNEVRVVVNGNQVEHWLNGERVVAYELHSEDWQERVAASKFAQWPEYGMRERGLIVLQDHGDRVWYRNVKVRELP